MPPSAVIVDEAWKQLGFDKLGPADFLGGFDSMLHQLFEHTLVVLEQYEQAVDVETVLPQAVLMNDELVARLWRRLEDAPQDASSFGSVLQEFLRQMHPLLKGYYLSISQSRKQRGGKDFELQFEAMLRGANIPFEKQDVRSRVDLLLPSRELFDHDKLRAVVLSLKRTLRERWKNVADEIAVLKCPGTYLVTTETVKLSDIADIWSRYSFYFVVWDQVKQEKLASSPAVMGFSKLIADIVTYYVPQWAEADS